MCMKEQYIFLTVLVPGPHNPKDRLDVYLQPLIAELKHLREVGVPSYDISTKKNFQLRAALMWTISDLPAYAMLFGWSTSGALACLHCMEVSDGFTLRCSGKQSWFDNHCKFLPVIMCKQEHLFPPSFFLIRWSTCLFTCHTKQRLSDQSNIGGCILLKGIFEC